MKKFVFSFIAILMVVMIGMSAMASSNVKFDVIDGQKVMYGEYTAIIGYLSGLDRQELIDLAEIDRGQGPFYARVLPSQFIQTWADGSNITAYDLSQDMEEYRLLQNGYLLVQDEEGNAFDDWSVGPYEVGTIDDEYYPGLLYNPEMEALNEEYTIAECYPNEVWPYDILSEEEGFTEHEMFKALVLAYDWSEKHQDWVYFMAWLVVEEEEVAPVRQTVRSSKPAQKPTEKPESKPTKKPTAEPTKKPESKPTKKPTTEPTAKPTTEPTEKPTTEPTAKPTAEPTAKPTTEPTEKPTAKPTKEPENNPRATEPPEDSPENNPRPTEGVPSGEGEKSTDTVDPLPTTKPTESPAADTGSGQVSKDSDPFKEDDKDNKTGENSSRPSEDSKDSSKESESTSHTDEKEKIKDIGSGQVSFDPDPIQDTPAKVEDKTSTKEGENTSRPTEDTPKTQEETSAKEGENTSRPAEESSSTQKVEDTGSGTVSFDPDPFA